VAIITEIDCEDGRWMELVQNHVLCWALVLAVLNVRILLPYSHCIWSVRYWSL